jgi:hypothetical protein
MKFQAAKPPPNNTPATIALTMKRLLGSIRLKRLERGHSLADKNALDE